KTGRDLPTLLGFDAGSSAARAEMERARAQFAAERQRFGEFLLELLKVVEQHAPKSEVVALGDEIVALTRRLDDPWAQRLRIRVLLHLADVREALGEYTSAQAALETALKLAAELEDAAARNQCVYKLGTLAYRAGNYEQALDYFAQAAQSASPEVRWRGLVGQSAVQEQQGEFAAALACLDAAWEALPPEVREGPSAAKIYIFSARVNVFLAQGDYVQAEALSRTVQQLAQQAGDRGAQLEELTNLALCRLRLGDAKGAWALCAEARHLPDASADRRRWALLNAVEAQVHLALGNPEAAQASGEEALRAAGELGEPICQWHAHLSLGDIYLTTAPHRAFYHYQQAVEIALAGHLRKYEAEARQRLAQFHLTVGEWAEAQRQGLQALAQAQALHAAHVEAQAWTTLAQVYQAQGRPTEAAQAEQAARELARRFRFG
ncbi:MAG TPA: tetratricopeptide repeat protein, partial [Armatimonadetes bacterium]|nr:tetratricopeptide repeat protein [Armatimonadota bacterium]